jgi:predicted transcriptional regulator
MDEENRKALILEAQALYGKGLSRKDISALLEIPIKRLRRYLSGDANQLCKDGRSYIEKASSLDVHYDKIRQHLKTCTSLKELHSALQIMKVRISYSTLCRYCNKHFDTDEMVALRNPPVRHAISRRQIRQHIWSGIELDAADRQWLFEKYPELPILSEYISGFRKAIDNDGDMKTWIANATSASLPSISSFAKGLQKDLDAVLNATRFAESNAFLEGNVNRLKMIKRSMYGRAGLPLLSVKVIGKTSFF